MTGTLASAAPALAIALPLLAAVLAAVGRGPERLRRGASLAAAASAAALAIAFAARVATGGVDLGSRLLHVTPTLWLQLRVDAAGATYGATVAALWLLALVHSFGYLPAGRRSARYYGALMASLAALLGVAWAGDLLSLLVFYEAFSLLAYLLIAHEQTPEALAAGTKYLVYVLMGGTAILAGVLLVQASAGGLAFVPGGLLAGAAPTTALRIAFACLVAGFGVKAALLPLHGWVPDAHPAAPAPISALLSGVMVAAGGFAILRVVAEVFGPALAEALGILPWLAGAAAASALFGALAALAQPDLKRRLAYSTISQMGYLTLAIALAAPLTIAAALLHLVHHAFLKGTLFLCAGVWIRERGARTLSDLRGIAARTPWTAAAFALAALGMMGTPPLSGFVSKWWLGVAMLEAGAVWALAVLLAGALGAAAYLLPVVATLYAAPRPHDAAGDASPNRSRRREAPATMLLPTLVAAALTVVFGLAAGVAGFPLDLATRAAAALLGGS